MVSQKKTYGFSINKILSKVDNKQKIAFNLFILLEENSKFERIKAHYSKDEVIEIVKKNKKKVQKKKHNYPIWKNFYKKCQSSSLFEAVKFMI